MVFDDPTAISAADLASTVSVAVIAFWNTTAAGATLSVASYISNRISRAANATKIQGYKLQDGPSHSVELPEGPPVFTDAFQLNAPGSGPAGGDLPGEVAICMSFHGPLDGLALAVGGTGKTHKGGTRPQSRVRGRCYIGPFNSIAIDSPASEYTSAGAYKDIAHAGGALRLAAPSWAVWSRKNGTTTIINGGFVDNEWDTVRRRRVAATTRALF